MIFITLKLLKILFSKQTSFKKPNKPSIHFKRKIKYSKKQPKKSINPSKQQQLKLKRKFPKTTKKFQ